MIDLKEAFDTRTGEGIVEVPLRGRLLLDCSLLNKGSAFSDSERREFGLIGLLPCHISTLEEQVARRYEEYQQKTTELERFLFLRDLQDRNETLFYRLLTDHCTEMLATVYTPEVGEVCQRYSHIYHRPRGLFISYPQRLEMDAIFENRPCRQVDVIVVTDGERILGLGDQGVGGLGIPVGKLTLYTLCGGVDPARALPIVLDVGTDNRERLADPDYLGWRHERVRGPDYDSFIESFVQAVQRHLPGVLLQWEDFAQNTARELLNRYRDQLCTFNDDIQGTAAVTLAVLLAGARATGSELTAQRIVIFGAGSAGTGISDLLVAAMTQAGLTEEEARSRLWLVGRHGLLHAGMNDLKPAQQRYRQPLWRVDGWQSGPEGEIGLAEVVRRVQPTALIGVSGQPGAFAELVVREMAKHVDRPIILPLSNPTSCSEARPADLVEWTAGRALIATGSPFRAIDYCGRTIPICQCNNAYVFPGVGMGVIASGARRVTEEMFLAAASILSDETRALEQSDLVLLPPLEQIRAVSRRIAIAVGAQAQRQGLARPTSLQELEQLVDAKSWEPRYRRMHYRPYAGAGSP